MLDIRAAGFLYSTSIASAIAQLAKSKASRISRLTYCPMRSGVRESQVLKIASHGPISSRRYAYQTDM